MSESQDVDSSRLVFVSVKGPKSKRKVAVPISDETDWQSFVDTVRLKLKLSGVGDMHLASTGELVQSLDQLQDIDEVQVIEAEGAPIGSTFMDGKGQVRSSDVEITPDMAAKLEVDSNYESKYVKKQSDMQRTMKRMLPGLFRQNSLPVTTRDTVPLSPIEQVKRRMKKRNRRSVLDPRTVLAVFALLSCAGTLLFVYLRATHDLSNHLIE